MILLLLLCAIPLAYWSTALAFVPVPWPDDSAFFLPGLELVSWPPVWRMHAQAAFIPSYDLANFNTMPAMPLLLGLGARLGVDTSHGIRFFGMAALAAWACLLALWMRRRGASERWVWLVTLAAVFSPAIRWGAMVVRPEIWQGLFWLLILMELDGFFRRPSRWRLPAILAGAAYFHFEAFYWVIPTTLGVALAARDAREAIKNLLGIAWRTTALLGPWLAYVLWHFPIFIDQMRIQFGRLEDHHPYLGSAYGLFHSLFLQLGAPEGYPKFFNLGKGIIWATLLLAAGRCLVLAARERGISAAAHGARGARVAALAALASTLVLWCTKPETWFTALIHLSLWPLVVLAFRAGTVVPVRWRAAGAAVALGLLIVLEVGVGVRQISKLSPFYSWEGYRDWVSCLDRAIGERTKVWQPHWPDALVELAGRHPARDYTRAVDFQGIEPLLERHALASEVIIHSLPLELDSPDSRIESYEGAARPRDLYYLTDYPWIPFKQFSALRLPGPKRELKICQRGPFWAAVTLK